jgi:hypothetical protein
VGETVAAHRLPGAAEAVGGGTHFFLDRPEREDELRDYERLTERTFYFVSAIGEGALRWSSEVAFSFEDGGFFSCRQKSLFLRGGRSGTIAFPSSTPCQKEHRHLGHKEFHLPDISYAYYRIVRADRISASHKCCCASPPSVNLGQASRRLVCLLPQVSSTQWSSKARRWLGVCRSSCRRRRTL